MRKIFPFILAICLGFTMQAQDIVGRWNGSMSVQGYQLRLVFNITKEGDAYKATMDSPDQNVTGIPISTVTFENNKLSLKIAEAQAEFEGELKDGQIKGNFKQMGYAFPMTLSKGESDDDAGKGFLKGRLADSQTKEGLPFASVLLVKAADTSYVAGQTSNDNGFFDFQNLKNGFYQLRITNVGYQDYLSPAIELKKGDNRLDVGTFLLNSSALELKTVEIVASRPMLEQQADKLIYNVAQSSTSVGDNALETLKKFPGVTVDQDENISLNGKSGVMVMVDDRPTRMSGSELANLLKSLPSSSIEKIEAIDNPSAKYDAEGVSGILNIKTKKSRMMGYNGSVFAGVGYAKEAWHNEGFDLNFRSQKMTVYGSMNFGMQNRPVGNESETGFTDGSRWETNKTDDDKWGMFNKGQYLFGKVGIDYFFNSRNILSLTYQGMGQDFDVGGTTRTRMIRNEIIEGGQLQEFKNNFNMGNQNLSLNYQFVFDSALQRQIFFDAGWVKSDQRTNGYNDFSEYYGNFDSVRLSDPYRLIRPLESQIFSVKADLELPLKNKKTRLEAGLKYSLVKNDNEQNYYIEDSLDPNRSNRYLYEEQITAAYAMVNHTFSPKTSVQLGLRAEYTSIEGRSTTMDSTHDNQYFDVFPTLNINQKLNDKNGLNFSYRYRLSRPRYTDLNPFIARNSAYSLTAGNPYLNPEYSHSLSLRYSYNHMPVATLSYDRSDGNIYRISYYDNYVETSIPENIGKSNRISLSLMNQQFFFNRWRMMIYLTGTYSMAEVNYIDRVEKTSSYNTQYYISNDITLPKDISLEVSSWGVFPGKQLFSESKAMFAVNMGLKKSFLKKSLTVTLSLNDIFNTGSAYTMTSKYPNGVYTTMKQYWTGRMVFLRVSYRFGKGNIQPRQRRSSAADEESNRLGGQQGGTGGGSGQIQN